jgi:hypothetical protein
VSARALMDIKERRVASGNPSEGVEEASEFGLDRPFYAKAAISACEALPVP